MSCAYVYLWGTSLYSLLETISLPIIWFTHTYSVSLPNHPPTLWTPPFAIPNINKSTKEFPLLTKAGIRLDVLLNATTRRNEQGNIIGVVGIGQDITGRLAQEREYTRLIDTANAPIFGVNQYGRVNVWNKVSFVPIFCRHPDDSAFWVFILPWHKAHDKYTHTYCFPFLYMIIYSSDW